MRSISRLFANFLIVFFLFLTLGCTEEKPGSIKVADSSSQPSQADSVSFDDTDFDEDQIGGDLQITKATDESGFDEYHIYWGSSATEKMDQITSLTVDGADKTYTFSVDTAVPSGATHFLVYSVDTASSTESSALALDIPDACIALVKDIRSGTGGSSFGNYAVMNDELYFTAQETVGEKQLWKSDGTESGTFMVAQPNTGGDSAPDTLTVVGNYLYFAASNGTDRELWRTDGTVSGSEKMTNLQVGTDWKLFRDISVMNSEIFFPASANSSDGREIWKSGGTVNDQTQVTNFALGMDEPLDFSAATIAVMNDKLFFMAGDNTSNYELWSSDNTYNNQSLVKDIDSNNMESSRPSGLTVMNGTLYFSATDTVNGRELWKSDGTNAGTVQVKDIFAGSDSGIMMSNFFTMGSSLFFTAQDSSSNEELWTSDGTNAGTTMVKDIYAGDSSYPGDFVEFSGQLYFTATSNTVGKEVWRTDGTDAGTELLKDIWSGTSGSEAAALAVSGNYLFFFAKDSANNLELWRSDGTEAGTIVVSNFTNDICTSDCKIIPAGSIVFFNGETTSTGQELFKFYYK